MALKPCLGCRRLIANGSRCPACAIERPRGRRLQAMRQAFVAGRSCAYCGQPADHLDHVIPVSRGGSDSPTNLQALCAACNRAKDDR